jgi:hypothetical protein
VRCSLEDCFCRYVDDDDDLWRRSAAAAIIVGRKYEKMPASNNVNMAGWIRKSTPTLVQIIHCLVHHSSVVIQFVVGKALSGGHNIMGHILYKDKTVCRHC